MTDFSKSWVNLVSSKLGARAISCSDDFFAPMERMLNDRPPVFIDGKYDDHGKWMDGWESRRRRGPGHDWCIVKLARPGVIHGIEIDTTHFTGNYPPEASVDACVFAGEDPDEKTPWRTLLGKQGLRGDSQHQFAVNHPDPFTHVRVNIYPDGGIARLRVFAAPKVDWDQFPPGHLVDIAASLNGGVAVACNNEHYGAIQNILAPGRGVNMGDGWETRRRREPGNDWVVIALARPGIVRHIEVDTAHFKGNYPDTCSVQASNLDLDRSSSVETQSESWNELLSPVKLQADCEHRFTDEIREVGAVRYVRLNIYPDGGISRLRMFAEIVQ
ncbi:MAG: allantoicase [Gammaproteobacteria bacterium]|nr:allantoicase [Gammaproteobacteria bacterium]